MQPISKSKDLCEKDCTAHDAFLKERLNGLGGTDLAAICGCSKYKTPLDIYLEKIGEAEPIVSNLAMDIGSALEDGLLNLYQTLTGIALDANPGLVVHKKYQFLRGHIDGWVSGSHVVEIKCPSNPNFDEWAKTSADFNLSNLEFSTRGDIPDTYYYQIQHYMHITGLDEAHLLAFLHGFNPLRLYRFKRDPLFILKTRTEAIRFWNEHVLARVPPPKRRRSDITKGGSMPTKNILELKKGGKEENIIHTLWNRKRELKDLEVARAELKKEVTALSDEIIVKLEDYQEAHIDGEPIVSFKPRKDGARVLRFPKPKKGDVNE